MSVNRLREKRRKYIANKEAREQYDETPGGRYDRECGECIIIQKAYKNKNTDNTNESEGDNK